MSISEKQAGSILHRGFSRRQLGRIASVLTAGAAFPFYSEFAMAQEAERRMTRGGSGARAAMDPDAIRVSSNENPLGPSLEDLEAIYKVAPHGGRYSPFGEQADYCGSIGSEAGLRGAFRRVHRSAPPRHLCVQFAHAKLGDGQPRLRGRHPCVHWIESGSCSAAARFQARSDRRRFA